MHLVPRPAPATFETLLTLYLAGHIDERQWNQITHALDTEGATPAEREALALFFFETLLGKGTRQVKFPQPHEVQELLSEMRATTHKAA